MRHFILSIILCSFFFTQTAWALAPVSINSNLIEKKFPKAMLNRICSTWVPENKIVWDSWAIQSTDKNGDILWHIYFLQAEDSLSNRENFLLRRDTATLGYATTRDFVEFSYKGTVLEASKEAAVWDNSSIWSGCTYFDKKENNYKLLYTSVSKEENMSVQRMGVAVSSDLSTWTKKGLISEPSRGKQWYETLETINNPREQTVAWRDPFVFYNPKDGYHYALICARKNQGDPYKRGCIGLLKSKDLYNWETLPPIFSPDIFMQMEMPSLYSHQDKDGSVKWYLSFSVGEDDLSSDARELHEFDKAGIYYIKIDSLPDIANPIASDTKIHYLETGSTKSYTNHFIDHKTENIMLSWLTDKLALYAASIDFDKNGNISMFSHNENLKSKTEVLTSV